MLDELLERLSSMSDNDKSALSEQIEEAIGDKKWIPNPGPQTEAYLSKADLLYVGGAGGGRQVRSRLRLSIQ